MYNLVSAIAKPFGAGQRWREVDIETVPLLTLFNTYSQIHAILTNPFVTGQVGLDLQTIRSAVGGTSMTFPEFLTANGNNTLQTFAPVPELKTKTVKYADAFHAGYKIQAVHSRAAADAQLPPSEKTWLKLTRPQTNYSLFYSKCLVNVNGFFHMLDMDSTGIFVVDGMKSQQLSGMNTIGIMSFREVANLQYVPITPSMVYKQNPNQALKNQAFVQCDVDLSNKTIAVVIGGYLHILDDKVITRVSDKAVCISMQDIPIIPRYFGSRKYIDFTSLDLEKTTRNDGQIDVEDILSDESIIGLLTLSQSFLVIIDNPNLYRDKVAVRCPKTPNHYVAYTKPNLPLVAGYGKVANYWYVKEHGQYSITTHDTLTQNYVFDTVDVIDEISVSNQRLPGNPVTYGDAYFLEIGTDL